MLNAKKDFTQGPLFIRIFLFAIPILLTGVLQIVYGMADNIVVGQFSGDPNALASVGSTTSLTNLVINLLLGCSAGTGVVVAQLYGAHDNDGVSKTVHTAMSFSLFSGIAVGIIAFIVSKPVLTLMGTKPEVLDGAVLYFRIIAVGIPATSVYNFGASILRSVGDSRTPLIILASSGLVNVALNLLFVIVFDMSVAGVAIATIVSQYLSAISVCLLLLFKRDECYGLLPSHLRIHKRYLLRILRYGIPAGIQSSMFSISNVLITSAMNSFSTNTVTANTIASNIDGISFTVMNAFSQAAMTFTGQNYGAGKRKRVNRVLIYSLIQVLAVGLVVTRLELFFGEQLASLYISPDDPNRAEVISIALQIMELLLSTYFIAGIMDVMGGALRGIGYSLSPMIINIVGVCGMRVLWIFTAFTTERFHTPTGLMLSYPITWSITLLALAVTRIIAERKLRRTLGENEQPEPSLEAKTCGNSESGEVTR